MYNLYIAIATLPILAIVVINKILFSNKQKENYLFKVTVVGDAEVGKSSFVLRYADNTFTESYISTIGVDFKIKEIKFENYNCKISIWDTAGQERFRTITNSYYRGANGIILIYDISKKNSFENVIGWMKSIEENTNKNVRKLLVGNKSDLFESRQVSFKQGQAMADRYGMKFIETSSKNSSNVEEAFFVLAQFMKDQSGKY